MSQIKKQGKTATSIANKAKGNKGSKGPTNTTVNKEVPNFWVERANGTKTTVDPYKDITGADAINAGGEGGGFANTFDLGLARSLKSGLGILGKVKSAVGIAATAKGIFSGNGSFLDKIGNISGLSREVMTQLNIPQNSELFKQITAATNVVVTVGGTARKLQNVDWGNVQSIASVLSQYTQDNELFKLSDLGVEGKFAATLINEAVRNGFPDSFEKMVGVVSNSTVLKGVLGDILPNVMAMSDLNNLKGVIDFVGGKEMQALFPGIVEDFSRQYSRQWWNENDSDVSRYQEFHSTMKALDDKWWKTNRGKAEILSVERIINGSAQFKDMYVVGAQMDGEQIDGRKLLTIVSVIKPNTVEGKLRQHFPHVLFKQNIVEIKPEPDFVY